jgi:hypothetical protein
VEHPRQRGEELVGEEKRGWWSRRRKRGWNWSWAWAWSYFLIILITPFIMRYMTSYLMMTEHIITTIAAPIMTPLAILYYYN